MKRRRKKKARKRREGRVQIVTEEEQSGDGTDGAWSVERDAWWPWWP